MVSMVSNGVLVRVEVFYIAQQSNVLTREFTFAYRIYITNQTGKKIQLLRRHWHIIDSGTTDREVQGDGVVGYQPIIENNEEYTYTSGCVLRSEIGKMFGTYTMQDAIKNTLFEVKIPEFLLVVPYKLN